MRYHIIMNDGSEYLMHHGIKGMKWGQWSPETAARYSAEGKGASAGGGGGAVDDEYEKELEENSKKNSESIASQVNQASKERLDALKKLTSKITYADVVAIAGQTGGNRKEANRQLLNLVRRRKIDPKVRQANRTLLEYAYVRDGAKHLTAEQKEIERKKNRELKRAKNRRQKEKIEKMLGLRSRDESNGGKF